MRRTLIVFMAGLVLAGCIGGGSTDPGADTTDTGDDTVRNGTVQVNYTASGFSPQRVTVAAGTTVVWVNQGSVPMWVATDEHPTHTGYDGTALRQHCQDGSSGTFDSCQSRQRYAFTFQESGSFGYHNHERAAHGGTIVVE